MVCQDDYVIDTSSWPCSSTPRTTRHLCIHTIDQLRPSAQTQIARPQRTSVIPITKRPAQRIHNIPKPHIPRHEPKRQHVLQRHLSRRRRVPQRRRPTNNILPPVNIEILPDRPEPINHPVMQEEQRVRGRRVEVRHRASRAPVPAAVDAEFVGVVRRVVALGDGLEVGDVDVVQ